MRILSCLLVALALMSPTGLRAQQDDRDFLTAFLEDSLSDAGREVTVTGFAGALASRATIQSLTIADAAGIWVTLNGITLDWSRSALLLGELEINTLTADEIVINRLPAGDDRRLPDPEARGFSLPELPVSVRIGRLAATRIALAPAVLGQAVEARLESSLTLADGDGQATLDLVRTDGGPGGRMTLDAGYVNASRQLVIELAAVEARGGIVASLLDLPGTPSVALTISGTGPIDNFNARFELETDSMPRAAGTVSLGGDAQGGTLFNADIAGNVMPLLAPDYAGFFGDAARLQISGARDALGGLRLDALDLATNALRLTGQLSLAPDGRPLRFDLAGNLGLPGGAPVVLPLAGADRTEVTTARIELRFDASRSEQWQLDAQMQGLRRPDIAIDALTLAGSGRIGREADRSGFDATLRFAATGAVPTDPGQAQALGTDIAGDLVMRFRQGDDALDLPRLAFAGQGYRALVSGRIAGLATGLTLTGKADAAVDDLARWSMLAGRPLRGAATMNLAGTGSPLGGSFDVTAKIEGRGLETGQAELDRLLADGARIALSARRDETGIALRQLDLIAASLKATASGRLATAGSDVVARLDFSDIGVLAAGYGGALTVEATLTGTARAGRVAINGQGSGLRVGQAEADRLLEGISALQARLSVSDGVVALDAVQLANPQVSARATRRDDGAGRDFAIEAGLSDLALVLPEFPGPVTLTGSASDADSAYRIDLQATGPAEIAARLSGTIAKTGDSADLRLAGTLQSALANVFIQPRAIDGPARFDLSLTGPLALRSMTGQIAVQDARFSDLDLGVSIGDLDIAAVLAAGRADLDARGVLRAGGTITAQGGVDLAAPHAADITFDLVRATLRDPELFEAETSGTLRLAGPLLDGARVTGRIDIAAAEIRIPSGNIAGLGAIPDIRHIEDGAAARETRRRAGLAAVAGVADSAGRSGKTVLGIDLELVAPGRLFLRGRGLDAELSGRLRLGGTSADIIPSGQFSLIRGRLDILGRRLTLSEANLQMQGEFVPFVAIAASSLNDGVTSTVRIDGPAQDPAVSFTSSPELPQDEVLARLLFGRGLENLSVFQAAQLANAVASLAGRGGEGIIGRLRRNFGLDDFDVTADDGGSAVLRAGRYISENLYTEVEIGEDGNSEIKLNLDIRPGLTVTGRVAQDGETGLGIFLDRDY